jgi:hypothetical protein
MIEKKPLPFHEVKRRVLVHLERIRRARAKKARNTDKTRH